MKFSILGQTEIRADSGEPIVIARARVRSLLVGGPVFDLMLSDDPALMAPGALAGPRRPAPQPGSPSWNGGV